MKNWLKIGLILIVYFFLVHVMATLISFSYVQSPPQGISTIGGSIVEINFGEAISVEVTRPRWYGTIYEKGGDSYLHVFDFIVIPKNIKGYNFMWFHLLFLIALILYSILIFTKPNNYKEENLKDETLGEDFDNPSVSIPSNDT